MITIQEVYDAYPNSDNLGIDPPGTDGAATDLDDIEEMQGDIGDTLFLFLCRELCDPSDVLTAAEAGRRLKTAINDLAAVREAILFDGKPPHLATLIATHMHSIFTMRPGDMSSFSTGSMNVTIQYGTDNVFRVGPTGSPLPLVAVGNSYAAAQSYLEHLFSSPECLVVADA